MSETVSVKIRLSDEGTFKKVEVDADDLRDAVRHIKEETDRLNGSIVNFAQTSQAIDLLQQSIGSLMGGMQNLLSAYSAQEVAETQLANNMRNTMDARDEDIQSIMDLCAAQQRLGVIGDEVQISGAQELATYLEKKSSLERLIPVMNDMLAQQYGLNASQENAAQIGSMLGKVMEGQTGALSRYGYSFDEVQEQILKFGTEEEKAAVLAEVVESAVGGMNAELAKTDSGRQQKLANTIGDIKEKLGSMAKSAAPVMTVASSILSMAANAGKALTSMKALAAAVDLTALKSKLLATHAKAQNLVLKLWGPSATTATVSTWALNAAVAALYATMTMGIGAIIAVIAGLFSRLSSSADDAADKVDNLQEAMDAFSDGVSSAKAELDMEINRLSSLIKANGDTAKAVDELNQKYGEAFGYHKTAAEWYDILTNKSKAYCMQIGYEAKAKALAEKIASLEIERDDKRQQRNDLVEKGDIIHNRKDGKAFKALTDDIIDAGIQIERLQAQWDTCISKMHDAETELNKPLASGTGGMDVNAMSYEELGRAIESYNSELSKLDPANKAEIDRLTAINKKLTERKHTLGILLGLEQKSKTDKEIPTAAPKTYKQLGDAISYYEDKLKNTDPAERAVVASLVDQIATYREKQRAIEQQQAALQRPKELKTLQDIDDELRYQQTLRKTASRESIAAIDAEIRRLNDLKTAFEDSSHVALPIDQIHTYKQLGDEISYYEDKLKHATETERAEIKAHINELQELKAKWDDTLAELEAPEDITRLKTISDLDKAISYYSARQKKASADEIVAIQRTINQLEKKKAALTGLTELPAMQDELSGLGKLSGEKLTLELELIGLDGIKNKIRSLNKMLADTKNPLDSKQRKEVENMVTAWEGYEKQLKASNADMRTAWGGIKGIAGGVRSITDALNDQENAWDAVQGIIDGVLSIYDGFKTVIGLINMLTAVSSAHTTAKTLEAEAEVAEAATTTAGATTTAAAVAANTTALGIETAAWSALSAAKTFAAHASIPFYGTVVAAGFIAAQQATIIAAAIPKFADGGLAYGPTLGIFGEYANASHNPEVVAPLDRLQALLGIGGSGKGGKVKFEIKGRRLVGVMEKEYNYRKRS